MREKRYYKGILSFCVLVLCMAFIAIFAVIPAKADNESVKIETITGYSESGLNTLMQEQKTAGYLYAGLFKSGTTVANLTKENAVATPQDGENYEAKFVPAGVLGINAQVSDKLIEDESYSGSSIRVVTAIDSTTYKEIGFSIVREDTGNDLVAPGSITKYVYKELYAVDATDTSGGAISYKPQDIHASANYFKTYTITAVPDNHYNTDLIVTPYWITYDGEKVYGTTSIKTVNLGRSWVYIGSGDALNTDGTEYGTYKHPYSDFSDALKSIKLENNGKIYIRKDSTVQVDSDFKWAQRGYDFTILGESGKSETLDFSSIKNMGIGDGVTFSKMTLKFNGIKGSDGKVFANGNRLKISEDVVSDNPRTYMFGGGYSSSVEETDITILAGNYLRVYGGANGTASDKLGVVTGDTNIIFGGDATAVYVSGAGASNSKVKGTCNVKFIGGTATEGIYGGGTVASAENADTSLIMSGGTTQQVIGGNQAGMTGNVYVEINGGTVTRRVYGGCYNEYLTPLDVLGTNKTAGWQNNTYVDGYITVVIKDNALPKCNTGTEYGILACSRRETKAENETGILIFNDTLHDTYGTLVKSSYFDSIIPYDYLVKANVGGDVSTKTDVVNDAAVLSVVPSNATKAGTVTDTNNSAVTYFKGEGVCALPSFAEGQTSSIVEVDFSPTDAQAGLGSCEARINGIYYPLLEDAVAYAKVRKDTPFVTLMKDADIEAILEIASGQTLKIQSENEQTWSTITGTGTSALFNVISKGTLVIRNLNLTGDGNTLYTQGTLEAHNLNIHDIKGVGIYQEAGTTDIKNVKIENATKFGIFVTRGKATADNVTINNVGTDGSNRYAIKCQGSGQLTITANNTEKNGVTITGMAKGGGITNASSAKLEATGVNIAGVTGTKYYPIYIEAGKEMEITDLNITRASGNTTELIHIASDATFTLWGEDETKSVNGNSSDGDTYVGRGVVVNGTFNMHGGNISNNKISSGNGAGVQVKAGGTFNMYGGNVSGNTAPNGGGVSLEGTAAVAATETTEAKEAVPATFNLEGGSVSENVVTAAKANNGYGAGGGVYITNGTLTMSSQSTGSISDNDGHNDGAGVYLGAGATFDMYNGSVNGNELTTYSARGGGVCINAADAVFTLHGGEVSQNIARAGGGIIIKAGEFVMNGGTLSKNQAVKVGSSAGQGGAIYILNSNSIFTMNDGDITGNSAQQGTAIFANNGIFNWNGGTFTGYAANSVDGSKGQLTVNIKNSVSENERIVINLANMKAVNNVE